MRNRWWVLTMVVLLGAVLLVYRIDVYLPMVGQPG